MFKALLINLAVLLGIAICMLLLPVILPLTVLGQKRYQKRLRGLAEGFPCVECGQNIGVEALQLADDRWDEMELQMMRIEEPVARVVRSRLLDAICPHCGCLYLYHKMEQTFLKRSEIVGQDPADAEMKDRWYRI